jgi:hypothetical protein
MKINIINNFLKHILFYPFTSMLMGEKKEKLCKQKSKMETHSSKVQSK